MIIPAAYQQLTVLRPAECIDTPTTVMGRMGRVEGDMGADPE